MKCLEKPRSFLTWLPNRILKPCLGFCAPPCTYRHKTWPQKRGNRLSDLKDAVDVSPRFVWVGSLTAAQRCQELQQSHFLTSPAPAPLSPARATHDRHLAAASDACELRDSRSGDPLPRRPPGPRRPLRRTRAPAPREPGRARTFSSGPQERRDFTCR